MHSQTESFGIIPLRRTEKQWQVLVILHKEGRHWGFPKGRKSSLEEEPLQAAQRELKEETGLSVAKLLAQEPLIEGYTFFYQGKPLHKKVYYYIAEVEGLLELQPEEIREAKWISLSQGAEILTFAEARAICRHVARFLSTISC